jgi:hypothetical protein
MLKQLAISAGLPLAGMALTVHWKELLREKPTTEDRLAILELLVATLALTIAVSVNDNDSRSPEARAVAQVATIFVGIVVFPVAGRLVRRAYNPDEQDPFTEYERKWANACGVWIFFVTYFFTHVTS